MKEQAKKLVEDIEDFLRIELITEDGIFLFDDTQGGFLLHLEGLELDFLDSSDLQSLHFSLRHCIELENFEEIQFICRKRAHTFEEYQRKIELVKQVKNPQSKRLREHQLSQWLSEMERDLSRHFLPYFLVAFRIENEASLDRESFVQSLRDRRLKVLDRFSYASIETTALSGKDSLQELALAAQGYTKDKGPAFDFHWPEINISTKNLNIDGDIFKSLIMVTLPEDYTELGMVKSLLELPIPLEISCRFQKKDPQRLLSRLKKKKNFLFALRQKEQKTTPEMDVQIDEIDGVLQRLSDKSEDLLEMTFVVSVRAPTEDLARRYIGFIESSFYTWGYPKFEDAGLTHFDCFLETLPLGKGSNLTHLSVLTSNAVHFLPIFKHSSGDRNGVLGFSTRYGNEFLIHPFGSNLANYNWLVSGTSGSGKSFFVNSIISQSMILNPQVFIVDIGGSYQKITSFLGGQVIQLEASRKFRISPFVDPSHRGDFEEKKYRESIELLFLEMCRENGQLPSIEERALLNESLKKLFGLRELPEHPIAFVCQEVAKDSSSFSKRLSYILGKWAYPSFYGEFIDWRNDNEWTPNPIYFDLKGLETFPDLSRVIQFVLCHLIYNKVRENPLRPKIIVFDEVAFSLLRWQPEFVDELVSTLRKYHAGAILVVQDLEKITTNRAGASILQNTQFKAILQQRGHPQNLRDPLGLSDLDVQAIASLARKRGVFSEIFLYSDQKRAILRYRPTFIEYYLGTSTPEDNAYLESQLSKYNGNYSEKILQWTNEETRS